MSNESTATAPGAMAGIIRPGGFGFRGLVAWCWRIRPAAAARFAVLNGAGSIAELLPGRVFSGKRTIPGH